MSHQFLDGSQVDAVGQQLGGEPVPQLVRRAQNAGAHHCIFDRPTDRLAALVPVVGAGEPPAGARHVRDVGMFNDSVVQRQCGGDVTLAVNCYSAVDKVEVFPSQFGNLMHSESSECS